MRTALDKFIKNASPVSAKAKRTVKATGPKEDLAAVREWAKANGFEIGGAGRIAKTVKDAYAEAQK